MKKVMNVFYAVLILLFCPIILAGTQIPVVNGSFETPDVAPGNPVPINPAGTGVDGWVFTYWKPSANGNLYIWDIVNPASEFTGGIPDGSQIAGGTGTGQVVEIGQGFDVNAALNDKYVASVFFGKSNTWSGTHAGIDMTLIPDANVVQNTTTDVHAYSWENAFAVPIGGWVEVKLPIWVYDEADVGYDLQIEIRAQDNMSFDNVRLFKVADNAWTGTTGNWNIPGNWQNGIPAYHDYALITNNGVVEMSSADQAYGLKIDAGGSLTLSSGGELNVIANQVPATLLGITGDAELIIDGGMLNQGAEFGGDLKAGTVDGSTVNIEVRSGTLKTRSLRLGESGVAENLAPSDAVVLSQVNMTQTGGLVDCVSVAGSSGRLFLPYSAGAKATYTMNGGTLDVDAIYVCYNGDFDFIPEGTFNLISGNVNVSSSVVLGFTTSRNTSVFNQTGGQLNIGGNLQVATGREPSHYSISNGALAVAGDITFASGAGIFEVIGSDANNISAANYIQNEYSTLKVQIDGAGVTPIELSGTAVFEAGAVLDVSLAAGGVPGTYNVLIADGGITDNGINNWSDTCDQVTYAVINGGTTLAVTYHADSDPGRCGEEPPAICIGISPSDLNEDCVVDFIDYAEFSTYWNTAGFDDTTNLLVNPSFEEDLVQDSNMTAQFVYPQGWFDADPLGIRNPKRDVRAWNPAGDATGADLFPDTGLPDGDNVSYSIQGQYGPALAQIVTLDAPLAAGDSFDLSFYYGRPVVDPTGLTIRSDMLYYIYALTTDQGNPLAVGNYTLVDSKYTWGSGAAALAAVPVGGFTQLDTTFTIPAGSEAIGKGYLMVYLVGYAGVCVDDVHLDLAGAICPPYDFTGDCSTDLADFAEFIMPWLDCSLLECF